MPKFEWLLKCFTLTLAGLPVGVAMADPHSYMVNNSLLGTCRPHTNCLPDWSLINFLQPKKTSCGCGYAKPHPLLCPHVLYIYIYKVGSPPNLLGPEQFR